MQVLLTLLSLSYVAPSLTHAQTDSWSVLANNADGTALAMTTDASIIISGTGSGFVRAVEKSTGRVLWSRFVNYRVSTVTLSSDNSMLLVGTVWNNINGNYPQNHLLMLDAHSGATIREYPLPHTSYAEIISAQFIDHDRKFVASYAVPNDNDATIFVFPTNSNIKLDEFEHNHGGKMLADTIGNLYTASDSTLWRWTSSDLGAAPTAITMHGGISLGEFTVTPSGQYAGLQYRKDYSTMGAIMSLEGTPHLIRSKIPVDKGPVTVLESLGTYVYRNTYLIVEDLATGRLVSKIVNTYGDQFATATGSSEFALSGSDIFTLDLSRDTTAHNVTLGILDILSAQPLLRDNKVTTRQNLLPWAERFVTVTVPQGTLTPVDSQPPYLDNSGRYFVTYNERHDTEYYTNVQTGRMFTVPRWSSHVAIAPSESYFLTYSYSPPSCGGPGDGYIEQYPITDTSKTRSRRVSDDLCSYLAFRQGGRQFIGVSEMGVATLFDATTLEPIDTITLDNSADPYKLDALYMPATDMLYYLSQSGLKAFKVQDIQYGQRVVTAFRAFASDNSITIAPDGHSLLAYSGMNWQLLDPVTLKTIVASGTHSMSGVAFTADLSHRLEISEDGIMSWGETPLRPSSSVAERSTESSELSIYPLPVSTIATLDRSATIDLYDALGRKLLHTQGTTLDCTTLPNGTYYLHLTQDGHSLTRPIQVTH